MKFEKVRICDASGYARVWPGYDSAKLAKLVNDFDIIGWANGSLGFNSGFYLRRLLTEGYRARKRWVSEGTECTIDSDHTYYLFDHGAAWKRKDGAVFFTGMPYAEEKQYTDAFNDLKDCFSFPESIKLSVMDDCYKYRANGCIMIAIYDDRFWENYFRQYEQ